MGRIERAVIVGAGLIGTSVALALREHGTEVALSDPDAATLRLACELGAGSPLGEEAPERPADIAVIAAPPSAVAGVLRGAQDRGLAHVYTDAASVKYRVVDAAENAGCDLATFVPGHPMAGGERSGPSAARADLFLGRSWALCPTGKSDSQAVAAVRELIAMCGAEAVAIDPAAHDRAAALVSHGPHVAAAAVAARLLDGDDTALSLAGQGVRDVTRIAAGDPGLWWEILSHNGGPVADVLETVAADLSASAAALREAGPAGAGTAAPEAVAGLLERGVRGRGRVPGKHGAHRAPEYTVVPVLIPDEPDSLGRLFHAAGEAGVNIEDVRLDHSIGLPLGVAQLSVVPEAAERLARVLGERGYSVHA
ncbi:prephenate dehydrogenase [Streptomonospora litoralis]|uniref:Prephenate dehydrogenase n=1 Tax=Streptomonospora litoralis TaxID=2498135 RepID=A0A4P6Q1M8_9ACTN|nr:prephenate dehydrogenase [Streptomonospora litoralis]QBI54010.1 prephenate dehydrogenase [Streptomonospora litoralis]